MQDVFVQLLRHQDRLDGAALSSLLFRMATHVCLNRLRTRRRRPEDSDQELVLAIAAETRDEARAHTRGILARLFAGERESTAVIATLHYVDRMTLEEVAAEVGLSVSGVRKRLRQLRAKLKTREDEGLWGDAADGSAP